MDENKIESLKVDPNFDFELVMGLMQETRLGGQVLEDMVKTFERWIPHLHAVLLRAGGKKYVALWLDEAVEEEVDTEFDRSSEKGFRLNCVGQAMIMNAVYQLIPEVEDAGCAPAPKPTDELAEVLEEAGVPYLDGRTGLTRRFSVLTGYPFKGACDICFLREDCPKANGSNESSFSSFELPGHVRQ